MRSALLVCVVGLWWSCGSTAPEATGGGTGSGGGGGLAIEAPDAGADAGAPSRDAGVAPFSNMNFTVPPGGDAGAMSCEWLDSDNCWKRQVDRISRCGLPDAAVGQLEDPYTCRFPSGQVLEFSAPVPEARDAGSSYWISAYRLRESPGGVVCLETAYGLGQGRYVVDGITLYSHSLSVLDYEVVCEDGSRFSNVPDSGVCDTFGLRYLTGFAPGHFVVCTDVECRIEYSGASEGRRVIARCLR